MKILFPILLISVSLSAQEEEKKQVFSRINTTKMQKLDLTDYKMLNSITTEDAEPEEKKQLPKSK